MRDAGRDAGLQVEGGVAAPNALVSWVACRGSFGGRYEWSMMLGRDVGGSVIAVSDGLPV